MEAVIRFAAMVLLLTSICLRIGFNFPLLVLEGIYHNCALFIPWGFGKWKVLLLKQPMRVGRCWRVRWSFDHN